MKLALEVLAVWAASDILIGIPIWMIVKARDRAEERRQEGWLPAGAKNAGVVQPQRSADFLDDAHSDR